MAATKSRRKKNTKNRIEWEEKNANKSGQAWNIERSKCIDRDREKKRKRDHQKKPVAASTAAVTFCTWSIYIASTLSHSLTHSFTEFVCVLLSVFFFISLLLLLLLVVVAVVFLLLLFIYFHGSRHFFPIIVVFLGLYSFAHSIRSASFRDSHCAGGCFFGVFFFSMH